MIIVEKVKADEPVMIWQDDFYDDYYEDYTAEYGCICAAYTRRTVI